MSEKLQYMLNLTNDESKLLKIKRGHFNVLAKKYNYNLSDLIYKFYNSSFDSVVKFEQDILKSC